MSEATLFQLAARHNAWANRELIEACARLAPELLEQAGPGTYGTIRATLTHLLAAETRYLAAVGGPAIDPAGEGASIPQLADLADRLGQAWEQVASGSPDPARERHGPRGVIRDGIILVQLLHHGSDHRSQVVSTLSSLGTEAPDLDVWRYGSGIGWVVRDPQPADG